MHPKDADRISNSVYPDQTAPLGAVWSGFTLFAQTYLSANSGSLNMWKNAFITDAYWPVILTFECDYLPQKS